MASSSQKKFISPHAWFSMEYPAQWSEFEDMENSFLFYNPDVWTGNFRISALKADENHPGAAQFGEGNVKSELKSNPNAKPVKIGNLNCAYSKEMFEEDGDFYVNHFWITGIANVAFACTFTAPRGGNTTQAEQIIATLQTYHSHSKREAEYIPIRVSEISQINESYELTVSTVKKLLKKDFQGLETDLPNLQKVIDSGNIRPKQKEYWLAFGITICVILANEVEGTEWLTLIDGNREAPVLRYNQTKQIIDPMRLVWSKVKAGEKCDVVEEYKRIIENI